MDTQILEKINQAQKQGKDAPAFNIGDSVKVHVKIREGDKERIQVFSGTVIARDGKGATETFTVRRISYGEGVERVFPVFSPSVDKIEIDREGDPGRAKLYYLRGLTGKKTKIREKGSRTGVASSKKK
ncbi:MAG: 50S ribosomal protein L19 [Verrucomicrobia bacterium]|nr:50S ribosomal protein L19 [Verrucomicrobiota bacterium]